MRGREKFIKVHNLILFSTAIIKLFPPLLTLRIFELFRNSSGWLGFGLRYIFLKCICKQCGDVVAIYPTVFFINPQELEIGNNVSIHQLCYFECVGGLSIGSNVSISHNVSIITHEHDYMQMDVPIREAKLILRPVIIEDDVWIGAGARILGGVTIGKGSVIGANAVVTRSIPPYVVAAGIPAKIIKERSVYGN